MPGHARLLPGLLIIATLPVVSSIGAAVETSSFATETAGYKSSNAFLIDPQNHSVVSPPEGTRAGDLLWIHPLRLNADE